MKSVGFLNSTFRDAIREKCHYQKSFKMKFIIVAVFMAIYLAVGAHSASVSYSISNKTMAVDGTADVHLSIPIEGVLDGLSKGKKHW